MKSISTPVKKDFVKVTGNKANWGAGYGLEVPVVYCLYAYIKKMEEQTEDL